MNFRTYLILSVFSWGAIVFSGCSSRSSREYLLEHLLALSAEAEVKLLGLTPQTEQTRAIVKSLARCLKKRLYRESAPRGIVRTLNYFVYTQWRMVPIVDTTTVENTILTRVIQTQQGSCLGLTGLYLVIGEQIGLPLVAICLPGHVFLQYQGERDTINIETLRYGKERSEEFYRSYYRVPEHSKFYLRALSPAEVVGLFEFNLANFYRQRGLYFEASTKYQAAIEHFPTFKPAYQNLINIYRLLKQPSKVTFWQNRIDALEE